jgi:ubiquinone/menaquinone biosynthesis C-methylase UbiE
MEIDNSSDRGSAFTNLDVPQNYRAYLEPYIFGPWAERLLDVAGMERGQNVLDIASGTGAVALAAAKRIGPSGRVVASDISPAMVAMIANRAGNGANIDTVQCPADKLNVPDRHFDRVLCQQGLPFISDRVGAAREMRRALRSSGVACVAVWSCEYRCEPFHTYMDVLKEIGVSEPYPKAYDANTYVMSETDVEEVFRNAGFRKVEVDTHELEVLWPDVDSVLAGLAGTPFGPVVARLEPAVRNQVLAELANRFAGGKPVTRLTRAVVAKALA